MTISVTSVDPANIRIRLEEPVKWFLPGAYDLAAWPLEQLSTLAVPDQIRWVQASRQRREAALRKRNAVRAEQGRRRLAESGLGWVAYMTQQMNAAATPETPSPANDNAPLAAKPRPKWPGILSSADFVRSFSPPDYAIDGIAQTGFLYSVTASTGTGKTAILLLISALAALGQPLGSREVKKGRVLYFAGENPDDVGMRWIGAAHHMGFDPAAIDVHFVPGTFDIASLIAEVDSAVAAIGGVDLVIIDTSAAYFNGTDENSNVDMGKHARNLRTLTTLPGAPCVLVACHPTKSADQSNLLPRGGGAFLAEVDGNLVCIRTETGTVKLHWQGKHRGPDFDPVMFDLETVTAPMLKDSRGRDVPTVLASVVPEGEVTRRQVESRRDEDDVLLVVEREPKLSQAKIAEALGWKDHEGKVHKRRAQSALESLRRDGMLDLTRSGYVLTRKGNEAVSDVRGDRHFEEIGRASATAITGSRKIWGNRTETAPGILSDD
jgi:RecA-family ATPase